MTYNFDVERWYQNERDALQRRLDAGEIDREAFEKAIGELDRRYAEMNDRLNGTYQLP
jgi:hypothetical protein